MNRRRFLALGAGAAAAAAGTAVYAWRIEPFWVELVRRPMTLENLPPALEGKTLLQISDMHVGPRVSSEYLIRTLSAARELTPDLVAFTGDFVSYPTTHEIRELARYEFPISLARAHQRLAFVPRRARMWIVSVVT